MHITFSPVRSDVQLTIEVLDDVVTLNGEEYDFSPLLDGEILPVAAIMSEFITSDVERINGKLHLTLSRPHVANAPESERFPEPVTTNSATFIFPIIPEEPANDEY